MVQEAVNGNWTDRSYIGGVMLNGSGALPYPQFSGNFAKLTLDADAQFARDDWAYGVFAFQNCELYNGNLTAYAMQNAYFTNSLFFRVFAAFYDQDYAISFNIENCTFYDGFLGAGRWSGQSGDAASSWQIENTSFDGTDFSWTDNYNGSSHTLFNYNAYNTNNLGWTNYPFPYTPDCGTNEVTGPNDLMVTNYNWQTNWFGDFYLPTNSPLIKKGSTNANFLGLYHFTTQTNQTIEGTNLVTIGYHYVATDTNGVPLDSNGDGIPDYLEDPLGNGLPYDGTNWALAINIQPTNQTVFLWTNVTLSVTAGGVPPLSYQWYFNSNLLANATNTTLQLDGVQATNGGNYYVIVTNNFGMITSSNAILTVYMPPTMTVGIGDDTVGQCDVPFGLTNTIQVTAGRGQSLALKTDGTVVAWGENIYGQGVVPTNLSGVAMISAGYYHDVALLTNGTVTAWGFDDPIIGYNLTNVPANLSNVIVIAAGGLHTLALRSNGTVAAWGYDDGFGETNAPAGLTNVTAISAGYEFNLVVSNGFVVAWGDDSSGQCDVPAGLSNVVDVKTGPYHSLALLQNGTVAAWGDDLYGETDVPAELSNVVAIAAGGDPYEDVAYSMALKSDGTLAVWGDDDPCDPVQGLTNVLGIAAGNFHALAVRTGPPTPVIAEEPVDQYLLTLVTNSSVTFTARGAGLDGISYQWQTNGMNLPGATNASLTVTDVQPASLLINYDVVVTDNAGMGSITSSNVGISLVSIPVIASETLPTNQFALYESNLTLSVTATAPGMNDGFPISYQWQLDGTNIFGATLSNYTFPVISSGTYSLIISNAVGAVILVWQVSPVYPGGVIGWGSYSNGQLNASTVLTNIISLAAGMAHGVVALDSGSISNWGSYWTGTNFIPVIAPPTITNAIAVAGGSRDDLALLQNGTVIAWGLNDFGQTNVPVNATNVMAIAANGQQSLALLQNGTVMQWGQTNAPIPAGLTNVIAIAAGTNFALALLQNSTVAAWGGNNFGQTNVPAGLSNVVAIAAGGSHALALEQNGTVVAWGDDTYGETNVPVGLSNVMNIAAGDNHSIALENNGTVICWGDNTFGQTNVESGLNNVKLIAGGGYFSLATIYSTTVMYPVNVSQDLLLIYNTNSIGSTTVENYYLQNRPLVSGANVLGIGCETNEITQTTNFASQILAPYLGWLSQNPTKHPEYLILFLDTSRVWFGTTDYPSVQYQLHTDTVGIQPFVTSINMNGVNGTNDCIAYINKLASISTNYSPGELIISACAGGYGNTNYYFEDTLAFGSHMGSGSFGLTALQGVTSNGVPLSNVDYDPLTNTVPITQGTNVAGYLTWGANGFWFWGETNSSGYHYFDDYYTNVYFSGNSGWWIIQTIESFDGERDGAGTQGYFLEWFSNNAFGGTNYSNTPIGAVSNVEEPGAPGNANSATYFGLWAANKNFAICAWNARNTPYFQAVGDPLVTK